MSAVDQLVRRFSGFEGEIRWDPTKPDGQPRRALDASRARERVRFVAETGFEEGLRDIVGSCESTRPDFHEVVIDG